MGLFKKNARKFGSVSDTGSSLGPNAGTASVTTGAPLPIAANFARGGLRLTIDPAAVATTTFVYGLLGSGVPSASSFHFALSVANPIWVPGAGEQLWTGPIQLIAVGANVKVGVQETQ